MEIRFLLGPAGSGKTFRCLAEIRAALAAAPEGPPLILLAPRQATFQLERQLLGRGETRVQGYTRLHILSFERLARFIFERLRRPPPALLSEEGRIMALRGLLTRKREDLKLFRASSRLTGFAQQLSGVLRELQRRQQTPETLTRLAAQVPSEALSFKLQDLAFLLQHYLEWLDAHELQDADWLLEGARCEVSGKETAPYLTPDTPHLTPGTPHLTLSLGGLWLDGFAELSAPELDLLSALIPHCEQATLAFCLDSTAEKPSWLSHWSVVRRTFEECKRRMEQLPGANVAVEPLLRDPQRNRFRDPALQHLEANWATQTPLAMNAPEPPDPATFHVSRFTFHASPLRLIACSDPEAEAVLAAREILRFVRSGGRFREAAVLVRNLETYHEPLQRVFARYEIPFFLDRREPVANHPLAELTRSALRAVVFQWAHDDWFAALKTGLVSADENEIDRLENEALARGWKGDTWLQPMVIPGDAELSADLEQIRRRIVAPFQQLAVRFAALQNRPTGPQLAEAVRTLWNVLNIDRQLEQWSGGSPDLHLPAAGRQSAVHQTVRDQMNAWLENVERAFSGEALSLREWLPILEAGLTGLTVGVIPPALDQVLIGAVDRSRNPDLNLALVLGLNEAVFPAPPDEPVILSRPDCEELERRGAAPGPTLRDHAARERYFGYIACTRAGEKLIATFARQDAGGQPLNPSPFISGLQQLFPRLTLEEFHPAADLNGIEHPNELAPSLAGSRSWNLPREAESALLELPRLARLRENLGRLREPSPHERLSPALAAALHGPVLRTSVSRLEEFAACPFRFFIHSGLRADERKLFELDAREQGTFQHDALKLFHEQLAAEGRRWRDLTPPEARERMGRIAVALAADFRDGLMRDAAQARFAATLLTQSLQDFIEVIVTWMRGQYDFDPVAVELEFGGAAGAAAETDLGNGHRMALHGRIDRVDLWREPGGEALGVVVDYKSGHRSLDAALLRHGVQLQLPAYLNVLRRWADPSALGATRIRPAGVFYVNLRGQYENEISRARALDKAAEARRAAYRHSGRFDSEALPRLDRIRAGDQFNYRLKKDGGLHAGSTQAMSPAEFEQVLDRVEALLVEMGRRIYAGEAGVDPYRKGRQTPCEFCDYRPICRIDPWIHRYRTLSAVAAVEVKPEAGEEPPGK